MRALLVEDDAELGGYLRKGLVEAGYVVEHAADGEDALFFLTEQSFDVVIMDRMLPKLDGLSVLREMRANGNDAPVLILSALAEVDDRVEGLRAGGDDYLTKPFAFSELSARLEALLRRRRTSEKVTEFTVGDLEMNLLTREVRRQGQVIELQPREFQLLEYLMRHAGQVVTRTMLLENVWGYHFDPQTNVIDVHISRLRAKLDRDFDAPVLHTVRGAGYSLRAPGK
tara:strand:+ start:703 stop:1383 length:681 start_codon:yes stop_codon:yes gene_type:complete